MSEPIRPTKKGFEQWLTEDCGWDQSRIDGAMPILRQDAIKQLRDEANQKANAFAIMLRSLVNKPSNVAIIEAMGYAAVKNVVCNALRMMGPDGTEVTGDGMPEALGESVEDLISLRGYSPSRVADELETGRFWL